jgi:hypothetical protein
MASCYRPLSRVTFKGELGKNRNIKQSGPLRDLRAPTPTRHPKDLTGMFSANAWLVHVPAVPATAEPVRAELCILLLVVVMTRLFRSLSLRWQRRAARDIRAGRMPHASCLTLSRDSRDHTIGYDTPVPEAARPEYPNRSRVRERIG